MSNNYETLDSFIQTLTEGSNIHICIHDISGILKIKLLQLKFENQIHSTAICTAAKSSQKGFKMCISCKMLANKKAITEKELFCGYCSYGLFEIVKPVVIDGTTQCIIYLGNLVLNKDATDSMIHRICNLTNSPEKEMLSLLKQAEIIDSPERFILMANLIDSYIRLLYKNKGHEKNEDVKEYHWAVTTAKNYIDTNFDKNISLKSLAQLYYINDKYLGRMFKKQIGCTFHEYLMDVRLNRAEVLLSNTKKKILTIALDCGFQNTTYFNRVFFRKHNIQPFKYRMKSR